MALSPAEDTVWLDVGQIAMLFDVQIPAITKYVSNIISSGELEPSTISILEKAQIEGGRWIKRKSKIITNERGCNLTKKEISAFNTQYGELDIRYSDKFHDRFIIIDETELYYCGASLKDAGRKVFAIGRINDYECLKELLIKVV